MNATLIPKPKPVLALEIYTNGVHICTAGLEKGLDAILASLVAKVDLDGPPGLPPKVAFHVSATDGETAYNWRSYPPGELQVGDRIEIRIVETDSADKPIIIDHAHTTTV